MRKFKFYFTFAVFTLILVSFISPSQNAFGQTGYNAIGAKKPANSKVKQITFVGCRLDGVLGKYKGPRKDVGTATFVSSLTAVKAKKLIKPASKPKNTSRATVDFAHTGVSRALVNGKIPYSTKKNLTALNNQIDDCVPTQTATATGGWLDVERGTSGDVNMTVTVDRVARTLTIDTSVSGFPLGTVDASSIPAERQVVSIPEGQTSAPLTLTSAFIPGAIDGTASIDETAGTFSASGTATHDESAGNFEGSQATWTASGPLSGDDVGSITITGNFPAGGNSFTITAGPSFNTNDYCKENPRNCL